GGGARPRAVRPPHDAEARRRPRGARRARARAESAARAGDRRSRQLLAHDLLRGAKAAPRTLPEPRVAGGPAGGETHQAPGDREGLSMHRRDFVKVLAATPLLAVLPQSSFSQGTVSHDMLRRGRPSDPTWPDAASWDKLNRDVGGNLIKVQPLLAACSTWLP